MRTLALLALIGLSGCSTPYQEMGFRGGVQAQQVTADTYRIVASGNSFTGRRAIHDYALLKAAETTKAAGATHFMIIGEEDATRVSYGVRPGNATTTFSGNVASTTYAPSMMTADIKPGRDTYIRVLTVAPGTPTPQSVYAADEVLQFVGSRVTRG